MKTILLVSTSNYTLCEWGGEGPEKRLVDLSKVIVQDTEIISIA